MTDEESERMICAEAALDELGGSRIVAYQVVLAHAVGSATAGLLLSQLWYWSKHLPDQRGGWFFKTMDDIEAETALTRSEQMTARKKLVELGVLQEERRGLPARMWFRIDVAAIARLLTDSENKIAGNRKLDVGKSKTGVRNPANQSTENLQSVVRNPADRFAENLQTISENTAETTHDITAAKGARVETPSTSPPNDLAAAALIASLVGEGVNRADAARLAQEAPDECRRQLQYLPFVAAFKSGKGAYLRSAIEQGFGPPKGYAQAQERQAQAAERARAAQAQRAARRQQEERQVALLAARARLEQDPNLWARIQAEAEAELPALLRGKPGHVAYKPALEARINEIVAARAAAGA